ncbi:hypothetical protein CXB51_017515 [Gossypium anomalum]|uniref:Cytochrome P450 n=1 Tax=Gossypium anomalum TaxID=47600 RepID=A0A8J5YXU2_9ROSI|nr:hypothetical protein CXB51_017515 [Gossypium anomalum]
MGILLGLYFQITMEICYSMFIAPFTTMLSFSTLVVFITVALCYLFKLQWQHNAQKPKQPDLPLGPNFGLVMKEMNIEIVCIRLGNVYVIPFTCTEISLQFLRKQDVSFASRPLTMATNVLSKGHLTTIFSPLGDQELWLGRCFHRKDIDGFMRKELRKLITLCVMYLTNRKMLIFNGRYLGEGKVDGGLGFEEQECVDAIFAREIMIAAVDNPSNALEWAFAEMLNNPKMIKKAKEELDNVVGKDRLVQESDFPRLNYIKACAREAFRLHPIVPFSPPHVSVTDTTDYNKGEMVLAEPDLWLFTFSRGTIGCPRVLLGSSMTIMIIPTNLETINLCQGRGVPFLAKPLLAVTKPRLPLHVYSFWTESEIQ